MIALLLLFVLMGFRHVDVHRLMYSILCSLLILLLSIYSQAGLQPPNWGQICLRHMFIDYTMSVHRRFVHRFFPGGKLFRACSHFPEPWDRYRKMRLRQQRVLRSGRSMETEKPVEQKKRRCWVVSFTELQSKRFSSSFFMEFANLLISRIRSSSIATNRI